ncbi:MAG TPA: UvrD-helicase domain-containing protein, partial [Phototrophicaceae bacterium]|nr:UvrD-helicase domain-containing protein [Phototrophicaceae bacterium]
EASAGTGKTWTIAALTARYVAEGVAPLAEVLVVTFGRAATSELRDRVRERLVSTARRLREPDARTSPDAVVRHLADADEAELAARQRRLDAAVADFDAATITTTHGFCEQMLTALGIAADVDSGTTFITDPSDLRDEVVDDLYLRRYAREADPVLTVEAAREVARAAVGDPHAGLEPADVPAESLAGHRYAFARDVVAEVARRKRARRLRDYDDLLVVLRDALTDPVTGAAAAGRVRSRYSLVLVDEFQDTDPVQWEILRTAFHGHRTLVLIGDPKQAIYAFRGGDVVTYLAARAEATSAATLGRNWRSDEPLLRGLDTLFRGAALGDEDILVRPVDAQHPGRRLDGGAPVRVRQVTREPFGKRGNQNPPVNQVRELIAADVAADVVRQLGHVTLHVDGRARPLAPRDVAVLCRRNADAAAVRDELVAAGVPAVVSGLSSVFGTPAADDWLTLLTALEQPGHAGRTAALALTPFVGWDARRLATAADPDRDRLSDTVRRYAHLLAEAGVAALVEALQADGLAQRLTARADGERRLTDTRHIGQLLHLAAVENRYGVSALTDWLRSRVAEAPEDYAEERSRRLETDAAAVQVVTVHASKGLEFPVVYVPYEWDRFESRTPPVLRLHDAAGRRVLHVGGTDDPAYAELRERHADEERGEDLRLLYVALTRAACQVVTWWAPSRNSASGPLSRLLLGGHAPGEVPPRKVPTPADDAVAATLAALAGASGGTVEVESVAATPERVRWVPPPAVPAALSAGTLDRSFDQTWRRLSYSGLTAAAHEQLHRAGPEPESLGTVDEVDVDVTGPRGATRAEEAALEVPLPLGDLPAGTTFGTLVHDVLEHVDTAAPDLCAELRRRCAEGLRMPGVEPEELADGLLEVLRTPLGPAAGGRTLADVRPADRLAELSFELPLAGGDAPTGPGATLADLAALVRHHLPATDPFAPYADRLGGLAPARLRGYLTGSIDAVLRLRDAEPRYLVVDYKTNRLAPWEEPLTAWHFRPAALTEAMMAAHYPLQLLLYLVALHRYLRWRQPGYDPETHLGGGLYLFVRGMCGPDAPVLGDAPTGVMAWRPPAPLVVALSDLLGGGR